MTSDATGTMVEDHLPVKKRSISKEKSLKNIAFSDIEEQESYLSKASSLINKGQCITPLKIKKKKHSYDEPGLIYDTGISEVNENGSKVITECEVVDENDCEIQPKKKKKKKKHLEENLIEVNGEDSKVAQTLNKEIDGNLELMEVTGKNELKKGNVLVESEINRTSHKKKKRKDIDSLEHGLSERKIVSSDTLEEKNRKSKQLESKVMTVENVGVIDTPEQTHKEEPKKRKKCTDTSSEDNASVGNTEVKTDTAVNELKRKSKKKKHSVDVNIVEDKKDEEEIGTEQNSVNQNIDVSVLDESNCETPYKTNRIEKKKSKLNKSENLNVSQTFSFNFLGNWENTDEKEKKNSEELQGERELKEERNFVSFEDTERSLPHRKQERNESTPFEQEIPNMRKALARREEVIEWRKKMRQINQDELESEGNLSETENDKKMKMNEQTTAVDDGDMKMDEQTSARDEEGDGRSCSVGGFTVIDKVKAPKKQKVERVLPEWLSNPTVVSLNLAEGLPVKEVLKIDRPIIKNLKRANVKNFFPIQAAVIPELLSSSNPVSMRFRPRDVCISAPTGSGKTLAYVLPIVLALRKRVVPRLRALILLPTQVLAKQVYNVIEKLVWGGSLKICLAVGSNDFKKEQKTLVFQESCGLCSVDILIATPGRLTEHINLTEGLTFKHLRFLVVDEADLFLSSSGGDMMLKIEQLKKHIHRQLPDNSLICGGFCSKDSIRLPEFYMQQVLVSATLLHDPEKLKVLDLHRPKLFITKNEGNFSYLRPEELKEEYVIVNSSLKPLVLYHLLSTQKLKRVLVFTKSTKATKSLSIFLSAISKKSKIASFSSKEANRKEIISQFSSGKIDVLISSDVMARGIDLTCINQVVSYDIPSLQNYVHRIGRSGRAGKQGSALSLVENTLEAKKNFNVILNSIEGKIQKIEVTEKELSKYNSRYQKALATLKETMSKEKRTVKSHKLKAKLERIKKSKIKKSK